MSFGLAKCILHFCSRPYNEMCQSTQFALVPSWTRWKDSVKKEPLDAVFQDQGREGARTKGDRWCLGTVENGVPTADINECLCWTLWQCLCRDNLLLQPEGPFLSRWPDAPQHPCVMESRAESPNSSVCLCRRSPQTVILQPAEMHPQTRDQVKELIWFEIIGLGLVQ